MEEGIDLLGKLRIERCSMNMFYGDEKSGKTTMIYHAMKQIGGKILYLDTENGFDMGRFKSVCGDEVFPEIRDIFSWTQLCMVIDALKKSKSTYDLVAVDSLAFFYRQEVLESMSSRTGLQDKATVMKAIGDLYNDIRSMLIPSNGFGIWVNWMASDIQTKDGQGNYIVKSRDYLGSNTVGHLSKSIYYFEKIDDKTGFVKVKGAKNIPSGTTWKFQYVEEGLKFI